MEDVIEEAKDMELQEKKNKVYKDKKESDDNAAQVTQIKQVYEIEFDDQEEMIAAPLPKTESKAYLNSFLCQWIKDLAEIPKEYFDLRNIKLFTQKVKIDLFVPP